MSELAPGETIPLEDGGSVTIIAEIGSGGQGHVYLAEYGDHQCALKWYKKSKLGNPRILYENLKQNIFDGAPSHRFLWPLKLTKQRRGEFGYLMKLRPEGFADLASILNNEVVFAGLHPLLLGALNIVDSFRSLHRKGKCYQDLNDGSFFINPETGDVLICDNDNITPDKTNIGMAGMPGYMAPEIVRGKAIPEIQTDYHSLAVILFKLLIRHDPFMGNAFVKNICITEEAEKLLYGDNPVFIFDPQDKSNAPVPGIHQNPLTLWPAYPEYVQKGFLRTFGAGLRKPAQRLTDNEWREILISLRGEILSCQCGRESFASKITSQSANGSFVCENCGMHASLPFRIEFDKGNCAYLYPGNDLFSCHTDPSGDDYIEPTARVVRNKNNPNIWALKNLSDKCWNAYDGKTCRPIPKGSVCIILPGLKIDFGEVSGSISQKRNADG